MGSPDEFDGDWEALRSRLTDPASRLRAPDGSITPAARDALDLIVTTVLQLGGFINERNALVEPLLDAGDFGALFDQLASDASELNRGRVCGRNAGGST